ncbi:ABC transporter substrate-binding protein [Noviherbaspirillum galbum]|uniref:ABC transporter substrate-binding protein n=1 Tax=Noviherbaspirillum galbum TaxID=2709383 RepID=A0A6B3SLS4_9BURK|nr:ABC transporter substrate-binding protein [Noviherbaspirillum galbum]NEX61697.1 ABC transporter substrate-binding protein [Noviherbaspirillum galbum]
MWKRLRGALLAVLLLADVAQAVGAADPSKVVRMPFPAPDDGFDMVRSLNQYSGWLAEAIFEPLLTYDYLARPVKLVPNTAAGMPEVSEGGRVYTFRLKKGIRFTPDPAFKGAPRELTAQDYAYSFKRLLDPANRSPVASFLDGKLAGMDKLVEQARKGAKFDYDAPVAGLQTPDPYTLRVELTAPDYNFLYLAANVALGAVAREAIEAYGEQSRQHPVGTGPFMLKEYVPRSRILLVANPGYRGMSWNFEPGSDPLDQQLVADMKGKTMPRVGQVEVLIIEEEQARWLAFQGKQIDLDWLPQIAAPSVLNGDRLAPQFASQGLQLQRFIEPAVTYTSFNMKDPVVGGYTKEKLALRRAIAMAYKNADEIRLMRNGQAVEAEMIIPPGIVGHDPDYRRLEKYDVAAANKLLDRFGYRKGADGYRMTPDGKPILLRISREAAVIYQEQAELWKRGLDQIGIRAEYPVSNFADNQKAAIECRLMMWGSAWNADYPDGENFLQLLYGPNARQGNNACYESPAYDALYKKAIALPPGAERNRLYAQMNRQAEVDSPWVIHTWRIRNWVARPWVKGFKKHPILNAPWLYLDVEKH